jgi:hypothetical protein
MGISEPLRQHGLGEVLPFMMRSVASRLVALRSSAQKRLFAAAWAAEPVALMEASSPMINMLVWGVPDTSDRVMVAPVWCQVTTCPLKVAPRLLM